MLLEAKNSYLGAHFGTLTQHSAHPTTPVLLTKDSPKNEISYDSQPPYLKLYNQAHIDQEALLIIVHYGENY